MTILITDPSIASRLRAERDVSDASRHDEVWEGIYIISPSPNIEHQLLASELWLVFRLVMGAGSLACIGVNVSDREEGWSHNYREPDVAVVLAGNDTARDCGTHWCGGPDFVVEILSPNDLAREKLPFYAEIGVRELLIIDRDPWALELYRLDAGQLAPAGRSSLDRPDTLTSGVLPLVFRLVPGDKRPQVELTRTGGAERWLV
jgi:Uma2 family endonuclease